MARRGGGATGDRERRVAPGPWALLGSGAALVIAGGLFSWASVEDTRRANRVSLDYEGDADRLTAFDTWTESSQRHATVAGVLYGVGGAAVAAAITWLVVDAMTDDSDTELPVETTFAPLPSGGWAGVRGRF